MKFNSYFRNFQGLTLDVISRIALGDHRDLQGDPHNPYLDLCKDVFSTPYITSMRGFFQFMASQFIYNFFFLSSSKLRPQLLLTLSLVLTSPPSYFCSPLPFRPRQNRTPSSFNFFSFLCYALPSLKYGT